MRSRIRNLFYLAFPLLIAASMAGDIAAQGKGKGGDRGGDRGRGHQSARQQAPQRQMPQMQRSPVQRSQPQIKDRSQRQDRPQWNPQAQRQQHPQMQRPQGRPQIERRQMPQWNSQAQRQQRPQMQRPQKQRQQIERRQMPQWNRQAQRQEQRQQRPSFERREARQRDRQAPQFDRRTQRQQVQRSDRQQTDMAERRSKPSQRAWPYEPRQDRRQAPRLNDALARRGGFDHNRDNGRDRDRFTQTAQNFERRLDRQWRQHRDLDLSRVNIAPFRDRARELRYQARAEGWTFNERDFRQSVWEYNQREAWRNDLLRSAISVNLGWGSDYYYVEPPAYPVYYGVNYEPWYYNIGYTYYQPSYRTFYVEPYYYAYRPFDYYHSSYYYDDPYYLDDPYDDFLTVRIFASNGSRYISQSVRSLLAAGYEQGYIDGLLARDAGYYDETYYDDPYLYYDDYYEDSYYEETTYVEYAPVYYSAYEDRRCLSEGYELGYRDALYAEDDYYDPYETAANVDLVSIFVGVTWQI